LRIFAIRLAMGQLYAHSTVSPILAVGVATDVLLFAAKQTREPILAADNGAERWQAYR